MFGPHLPRPGHEPDDRARADRVLRDVRAARRRPARLRRRRPDVPVQRQRRLPARVLGRSSASTTSPYSEDQAFGRALAAHPRWRKAYVPRAGVLHAHDYPPLEFMRRYFDEYRGLRETIGHVERFGVRSTVRDVRGLVARDRRWMREQRHGAAARSPAGPAARWCTTRGARCSRRSGSRGAQLPAPRPARAVAGGPRRRRARGRRRRRPRTSRAAPTCRRASRRARLRGDRARAARRPGAAARSRARAWRTASGCTSRSRSRRSRSAQAATTSSSSSCCGSSAWATRARSGCTTRSTSMHDGGGAVLRRIVVEHFAPVQAPVFKGFDALVRRRRRGRDGLADRVPAARAARRARPRVPDQRPRARVLPDVGGVDLGRGDLPPGALWHRREPVAARPLHRALRRHAPARSSTASTMTSTARGRSTRRDDTIVFYCRAVDAAAGRRARRRWRWPGLQRRAGPDVRIVMFGDREPLTTPFAVRARRDRRRPSSSRGCTPRRRSGVCLSLTNYSLIPQEMLACGLPCVDLDGASAGSVFGADGPVELVPFDADALADADRAAARRPRRARAPLGGGARVRPRRTPGTARPGRSSASCAARCGCAVSESGPLRPHGTPAGPRRADGRLAAARRHLGGVVPAFQAPDEQSHFTYVQSLAKRRSCRRSGRPFFSHADVRGDRRGQLRPGRRPAQVKPEWNRGSSGLWRETEVQAPRDDGGGPSPASTYPPTAYAGRRSAYLAASGGTLFDGCSAPRLMSALWVPTPCSATWLLAGEVVGRRRRSQTAAARVPALLPMFTDIADSVAPRRDDVRALDARAVARRPLRQARRAVERLGVLRARRPRVHGQDHSYALLAPAALRDRNVARRRAGRDGLGLLRLVAVAAGPIALTLGTWVYFARREPARPPRRSRRRPPAGAPAELARAAVIPLAVLRRQTPTPERQPQVPPGGYPLLQHRDHAGVGGAFGWLEVEVPADRCTACSPSSTGRRVLSAGHAALWRARRATASWRWLSSRSCAARRPALDRPPPARGRAPGGSCRAATCSPSSRSSGLAPAAALSLVPLRPAPAVTGVHRGRIARAFTSSRWASSSSASMRSSAIVFPSPASPPSVRPGARPSLVYSVGVTTPVPVRPYPRTRRPCVPSAASDPRMGRGSTESASIGSAPTRSLDPRCASRCSTTRTESARGEPRVEQHSLGGRAA